MVKMQGNAFVLTMAPVLDEYYENEEERKAAYVRHNGFFNTHAVMFALIAGLTFAMEKEKKTKGVVNDDTIESLKVALMGPTAGIGDAFFYNGIRVIAAGITMGLAAQGSLLAPILFILLYGGTQLAARWYLINSGFSQGTSFIENVFELGVIKTITKAASIVGLTMVGAMVAGYVNVPLNWVINTGDTELVVLDIINSIMPGILSLALLLVLVRLIKKGVKPITLVLGVLVLALVLGFLGIF